MKEMYLVLFVFQDGTLVKHRLMFPRVWNSRECLADTRTSVRHDRWVWSCRYVLWSTNLVEVVVERYWEKIEKGRGDGWTVGQVSKRMSSQGIGH